LLAALVEDIVAPGTYSGNLEGAQVSLQQQGSTRSRFAIG